jgi:hypothetical protein
VVGGGPVALFGMTVDDRIQVIARAGDLRAVAVDDHAVTVSVGVGVVSVSASSPLNIFWDRIGVRGVALTHLAWMSAPENLVAATFLAMG